MNELINGIRIVKFYAWERAFVKNITNARESELASVLRLGRERAVLIMVMTNTTTFVTSTFLLDCNNMQLLFLCFMDSLDPINSPLELPIQYLVLSVFYELLSSFFLSAFHLFNNTSYVLSFMYFLISQTTLKRLEDFVLVPDRETERQTGSGEPGM